MKLGVRSIAFELRTVSEDELGAQMWAFVALLQDAVNSGASVGFLPSVDPYPMVRYWDGLMRPIREGSVILLAVYDGDSLLGSVQLALAQQANGSHRAEVNKLMVHTTARRLGLGKMLMGAVEAKARELGRTLLVLDTRKGDVSETLYRGLGFVAAGEVPGYARSASGELHTTVMFYKRLD